MEPAEPNLRAAAPAADPGRSGNEANQMGTNVLRSYTGARHEIKPRGIHHAQVFDAIGIVGVQKGDG